MGPTINHDIPTNPITTSTSPPTVIGFYGNARGFKQASGEFSQQIIACDADIWCITEAHLKDDVVKTLIPSGYSIITRKDRSKHGGGLLLGAKSHLLANPLSLDKYNIPKVAEMDGFQLHGVHYIGCYAPNSYNTHILIDMLTKYMIDHPGIPLVLMGDFNVHHKEWLCSAVDTDFAGIVTKEFCESFGLHQYVDFPTRGPNTLDLIISTFTGSAVALPNLGTSDHVSIKFQTQVIEDLPDTPRATEVLNWHSTPWNHIRGEVKRALILWNETEHLIPDDAELALSKAIHPIIKKHVPKTLPMKTSSAPWWNFDCDKSFKLKMKTFKTRLEFPEKYLGATYLCKQTQRRAFKEYNVKMKERLDEMSTSDSNFWSLIKELSGLSSSKSNSAPSVEDLATHFAEKMSNGKDDEDTNFTLNNDARCSLSSFKISRKKVKKSLKKLDPSKSVNGLGPRFLKECADVLTDSVTRLFKLIVKKSTYVSLWKIQRVSPVHKRGPKTEVSKYRPVTVVDNLSSVFEDVVKPQFEAWANKFIPDWQYGFIPECGTTDYGAALTLTIQDCLQRRKQGVLIPSDIRGAFDRCWWKRVKNRVKKLGMRKRALRLFKSYLYERFLRVVSKGESSSLKQIFSSVPQGGKWSHFLFDLDISELPDSLSAEVIPFGYADDVALWYEVDFDHCITTAVINQDLEALHKWGLDNKTTFEPEKMCVMVISQKKKPFDPSGIVFAGEELSVHDDTTLVGLKIDNRMRWGPMVAKLATKARQRIGALYRIRHLLNSQNLKTMYMMFIRSIMEYNSVCWMGAAKSHLSSLDRIQHTAERMCGFTAEPLQARRDAAAMSFALKLLDGKTRGELKHFVPKLIEPLRLCKKRTRHTLEGTQVASKVRSNSLDVYKRGFVCALPGIWSRIPIEIINKGAAKGWLKIKNACSDFLTGKSKTPSLKKRKVSEKTETYSTKLNNELNGNVEI